MSLLPVRTSEFFIDMFGAVDGLCRDGAFRFQLSSRDVANVSDADANVCIISHKIMRLKFVRQPIFERSCYIIMFGWSVDHSAIFVWWCLG